jgi:hypothetical protein
LKRDWVFDFMVRALEKMKVKDLLRGVESARSCWL